MAEITTRLIPGPALIVDEAYLEVSIDAEIQNCCVEVAGEAQTCNVQMVK